jgi:hypothetical protein
MARSLATFAPGAEMIDRPKSLHDDRRRATTGRRHGLEALTAALVLALPGAAVAANKKPPPPSIEVRHGKKRIGTEVVRSKAGEANRYHSTRAPLRDGGRSFTQRGHVVLDTQNRLVTYDRWIDVKGATIRMRVFAFEGQWKQVLFGQPGEKNKVTDLGIKGAPVVFDERSPMINGLAPVLATKRERVPCIRVDANRAGDCAITRQALVDAAGAAFVRTTFVDGKFTVEVIRSADGLTMSVKGPGEYGGLVKGFDPSRLKPAASAEIVDADPPAESEDGAPPPPPSDDPEGHVIAKPDKAGKGPRAKAGDAPQEVDQDDARDEAPAPSEPAPPAPGKAPEGRTPATPPAKAAEPSKPAKPGKPAKPSKPAKPGEEAKPGEAAKPAKNADTAKGDAAPAG